MEDIDWMMARAAGYDAGFAFVANPETLKKNPHTKNLLNQMKIWEEARQKKIFDEDLLARLKNPDNAFHLEKAGLCSWELHTYEKYNFTYEKRMLQPGQPTYSEWNFSNNHQRQVPQISLLAKGEEVSVSKFVLEIDNFYELELPLELKAGESLVIDGSGFARIYNNKGRFIRKMELEQPLPELSQGNHLLRFDAEFSSGSDIMLNATVKIKAEVVDIR